MSASEQHASDGGDKGTAVGLKCIVPCGVPTNYSCRERASMQDDSNAVSNISSHDVMSRRPSIAPQCICSVVKDVVPSHRCKAPELCCHDCPCS
jgi:hypothetical protein